MNTVPKDPSSHRWPTAGSHPSSKPHVVIHHLLLRAVSAPRGAQQGTPKPSATGCAAKTGLQDALHSWISWKSLRFSVPEEARVPSMPRVRARQEHALTGAQHGGWSPALLLVSHPLSDKAFC